MRYTLIPKMHLSRLPLPTKILLTCFVLSIDVGLWVGSLKYTHRAEFSPSGATRYWAGDGASRDPGDALLPGEDEIAEPSPAGELRRAPSARKSTRFLVDTVHPHLFTVPIVLFILLHLLILTRLPDAAKIALHVHGFASFAATFGLPFWIAAHDVATGTGAALFVVAGVNLFASFALVSAILLFETWLVRGRAPDREPAT